MARLGDKDSHRSSTTRANVKISSLTFSLLPGKESNVVWGQALKANHYLHGCSHEQTNTITGRRATVNNIMLFAQNGLAFCTDVGYMAETWIHQE